MRAGVLLIGGAGLASSGLLVGCGESASEPSPPSTASLARAFIQHRHAPFSHGDLLHYDWHPSVSQSHCTVRDTQTGLGEGKIREKAARELFCHLRFTGTPTSVDGAKPALAAHKMRQQWYVAWHCGPRWTHCYVVSEQHVSPTGAGSVDNLYSQ
jgi:hypothetical protein